MSKRFAEASSYPLSWPEGFPRSKGQQKYSRFSTTLFVALENVQSELAAFAKDSGKKLTDVIISSNYSLSITKPSDAGVAVYFTWDEERTCIPVDRYGSVEENLQAIFHCIKAKRTMLRHGGINLVKAAFRGYTALPNPASKHWREVLDYQGKSRLECRSIYLKLIRQAHPDSGGSASEASEINRAWKEAQNELDGI